MKQLIKDYEIRLDETTRLLKNKDYSDNWQKLRLSTKQSCYRDFISELKKAQDELVIQIEKLEISIKKNCL